MISEPLRHVLPSCKGLIEMICKFIEILSAHRDTIAVFVTEAAEHIAIMGSTQGS